MTSLAAWPGIDSRGLSTLYIVADSRISWPGSSDHWEFGAKVFARDSEHRTQKRGGMLHRFGCATDLCGIGAVIVE